MSALVETMAFAGEVPWHGLGKRVGNNLTPEEILKEAGLDWEVQKNPLYIKTFDDDLREIPAKYALCRSTDNSFLSIVGKNYNPVQNSDAFSFFKKFVDAGGMEMHTAGSLKGGQYVWALAKLKDKFSLKRDKSDVNESYILLMSPHVVGKAFVALHTAVRVVCWNTLSAALDSQYKGKTFRLIHTARFDDNAKAQAEIALGLATQQFKDYQEKAEMLSGKNVNSKQLVKYFSKLFNLEEADDKTANENRSDEKTLILLQSAFEKSPGAQLKSASGTWWGAVNAVTWHIDHQYTGKQDNALLNSWTGQRGQIKRDALSLAVKMAA